MEYIMENVLYLIPALIVVGKIIKEIPNVPNWVIPFALLVLGIVAANSVLGWGVEATIQGALVAGAAVFGNQAWKQGTEAIIGKEQNADSDSEVQGDE